MGSPYTKVADILREGQRALRSAGIDSPGLDAEILLRESLGLTREQLFEVLQYPVRGNASSRFDQMIAARCRGVPVAYIIGRKAFYGHEFLVTPDVLVPRPETEYLVEWSLSWIQRRGDRRLTILDIGTGSGAVGVSVALEAGETHHIVATDVSHPAIEVAARNREQLKANLDLVAGSLLDWCAGPVDLIAANLPYLRPSQNHPGIEHEPAIALFSGSDGFALNRTLLEQASSLLARPGGLIMEIDPAQAGIALNCANQQFSGDVVGIEKDLAGLDRYLIVERRLTAPSRDTPER